MKANLDARYDLYINGQWVPASDGKVFTAYNPATGEKLAECAEATKEDVDAAVKAAWAACLAGHGHRRASWYPGKDR